MKRLIVGVAVASAFLLSACQSANQPQSSSEIDNKGKLTVGTVQKSITEGMTQAEVLEVLGSPNLVSRDKNGLETWAYDKFSTDVVTSKEGAYASLILIGGNNSSSLSKTSQRTLTIILKFRDGILKEFSYNSTTF